MCSIYFKHELREEEFDADNSETGDGVKGGLFSKLASSLLSITDKLEQEDE